MERYSLQGDLFLNKFFLLFALYIPNKLRQDLSRKILRRIIFQKYWALNQIDLLFLCDYVIKVKKIGMEKRIKAVVASHTFIKFLIKRDYKHRVFKSCYRLRKVIKKKWYKKYRIKFCRKLSSKIKLQKLFVFWKVNIRRSGFKLLNKRLLKDVVKYLLQKNIKYFLFFVNFSISVIWWWLVQQVVVSQLINLLQYCFMCNRKTREIWLLWSWFNYLLRNNYVTKVLFNYSSIFYKVDFLQVFLQKLDRYVLLDKQNFSIILSRTEQNSFFLETNKVRSRRRSLLFLRVWRKVSINLIKLTLFDKIRVVFVRYISCFYQLLILQKGIRNNFKKIKVYEKRFFITFFLSYLSDKSVFYLNNQFLYKIMA